MKSDWYARNLACGIWFALAVLQAIFVILRLLSAIRWSWIIVFIPLYIFLALPIVSAAVLLFLEED